MNTVTIKWDDKEHTFEPKELKATTYRIVGKECNQKTGVMERKAVGEPMTVILLNVPEKLQEVIDEVLKSYCNI